MMSESFEHTICLWQVFLDFKVQEVMASLQQELTVMEKEKVGKKTSRS